MPKRERCPATGSGRLGSPTNEPTDLTGAQWATIAPTVTTSAPRGGRPIEIDRRAIVNASIPRSRAGYQWRMLPANVPPTDAVRYFFDKWKRDGAFAKVNDALRANVRNALGRDEEESREAFIYICISKDGKTLALAPQLFGKPRS